MPAGSWSTRTTTTIIDGSGDSGGHQGPHQPDQERGRLHGLRLRPREAAGAPGQARRRCCGGLGRRCHRDRAQGEEAPRRGRAAGHPRRPRGGHRHRWRRGAAPFGRLGQGRRPRRRRADRRAHHPARSGGACPSENRERWSGGLRGGQRRPQGREGPRPERRDGRDRGPGRGRRDRAGQVTRSAWENAASIAKKKIPTTEAIVAEIEDEGAGAGMPWWWHARHGRHDVARAELSLREPAKHRRPGHAPGLRRSLDRALSRSCRRAGATTQRRSGSWGGRTRPP